MSDTKKYMLNNYCAIEKPEKRSVLGDLTANWLKNTLILRENC